MLREHQEPPQDQNEIQLNDSSVSFGVGQRGRPKLLFGGFSFICAKHLDNKKYWVCAKQRSRKCRARIVTDGLGTTIKRTNLTHNHPDELSKATSSQATKMFIDDAIGGEEGEYDKRQLLFVSVDPNSDTEVIP